MKQVEQRLTTIRAHLEAVSRGGRIDSDTLAVWLRELEPIETKDLDARIRQARNEHADKLENGKGWGRITPDDVLRVQRRAIKSSGATDFQPPENPDCPFRCGFGRASVRDPDGDVVCVRCSCFAGDYWKSSPVWGSQDNVEGFLARSGWSSINTTSEIPPKHRAWIARRASEVGPARALEEYRRKSSSRT